MSFPSAPALPAEKPEPPLDRPFYDAPFAAAVKRGFRKYATFSGRASRSEFWWWVLATGVVQLVLSIVTEAFGYDTSTAWQHVGGFQGPGDAINLLSSIFGLAVLVPQLALTWRRLHDVNRSGAWILIGLVPVYGWIVLIAWTCRRPVLAGRRFDLA
ncbi:hypothetical protein AX769_11460 [Frondihabitans sp. PAMC 28766]|uniref:DUF805 domain-containing protein n=1 Tax=Frondihabitans sp. PAMC 28766 TaxID=1795630 RepID=UPI00078D5EA7|nr:DUF805 domain-containing protein [Frondihabitans sp. PAMC 28766]AMM20647.1 hypothetical protein AX769_11460 [Frondihabitans sp. PAMC 28766]